MKWLMVLMVACTGCMPVGGGGSTGLVEGVDVYPDAIGCVGRDLQVAGPPTMYFSCARREWLTDVVGDDQCGAARGLVITATGYASPDGWWESAALRPDGRVEACLGGPQAYCTVCDTEGTELTDEWFGWGLVRVPAGGHNLRYGQGAGWDQGKATSVAVWLTGVSN